MILKFSIEKERFISLPMLRKPYTQVNCKNCLRRIEKEKQNEEEKSLPVSNVKDWNLSQSEDEEIEFIFKKKEEKKNSGFDNKNSAIFQPVTKFSGITKRIIISKMEIEKWRKVDLLILKVLKGYCNSLINF